MARALPGLMAGRVFLDSLRAEAYHPRNARKEVIHVNRK